MTIEATITVGANLVVMVALCGVGLRRGPVVASTH
jgi:hypothetical protein